MPIKARANTLSDFPEDFRIYACCGPCSRMDPIDRSKLPPTMLVTELRARVRCRACGQRTNEIRIVYVGKATYAYRDY